MAHSHSGELPGGRSWVPRQRSHPLQHVSSAGAGPRVEVSAHPAEMKEQRGGERRRTSNAASLAVTVAALGYSGINLLSVMPCLRGGVPGRLPSLYTPC